MAQFFRFLVEERILNFYIDEDFSEYVENETPVPFFSEVGVKLRNCLMDESFAICVDSNYSIYDLGLETIQRYLQNR